MLKNRHYFIVKHTDYYVELLTPKYNLSLASLSSFLQQHARSRSKCQDTKDYKCRLRSSRLYRKCARRPTCSTGLTRSTHTAASRSTRWCRGLNTRTTVASASTLARFRWNFCVCRLTHHNLDLLAQTFTEFLPRLPIFRFALRSTQPWTAKCVHVAALATCVEIPESVVVNFCIVADNTGGVTPVGVIERCVGGHC